MIMKQCLPFILLITVFTISQADDTKGKFALGFKGGLSAYFGDIEKQMPKPTAGVHAYYWPASFLGIGLDGGYTQLESDDDVNYFKADIYHGSAMLKFKPFPSVPVNPCIGVGFDALSVDAKGKDDFWLPNRKAGEYEKMQYAIPVSASLSVFLVKEVMALDLEVVHHQMLSDYLDDLKMGDRNDSYMTGTLGLTFYFGKALDSDKDGIADRKDGDPTRPEDIDGFKDADGVPDPDNDADGILDISDKAPNNPEDVDGFEDKDGAPDPDNDGDGILDKDDKCPGSDDSKSKGVNTKEDMDGFEDTDGCPDPDNDGDGINDTDDKCPDLPETFNEFEDEDGCPDEKPAVKAGESIVLEGVNFASGSSALTHESMVSLDKAVKIMQDNPEIIVEIRGYTDNTGSYMGNVRISQKRAESVRNYLVSQGIRPSRIMTKGFGPEDPIAPNTTREGRAKNRRIEFFRIK
jgi:outer membrane protein OmpA-like peptidoglycan-associated protein